MAYNNMKIRNIRNVIGHYITIFTYHICISFAKKLPIAISSYIFSTLTILVSYIVITILKKYDYDYSYH